MMILPLLSIDIAGSSRPSWGELSQSSSNESTNLDDDSALVVTNRNAIGALSVCHGPNTFHAVVQGVFEPVGVGVPNPHSSYQMRLAHYAEDSQLTILRTSHDQRKFRVEAHSCDVVRVAI